MKKVIVDTDIGSDIDDVLALIYLLNEPLCQLMGITTVSGESNKRAQLASALCNAFGQDDIPIFPGMEQPLNGDQLQPMAQQATVLSKYLNKKRFPKNRSINFLRETIQENPHEITLLTIGPLTNIATLFRLDPEIPNLLGELVMMSGIFSNDFKSYEKWSIPEWNTRLDPLATDEVYRQCPTNNKIIGLDTTAQVYMDAQQVKERLLKFMPPLISGMAEVWFRERKYVAFHDPLAAATIFNDDICRFKKQNVDINLKNPKLLGMTEINRKSEERKQNISVSVNPKVFFDKYFSVLQNSKQETYAQ